MRRREKVLFLVLVAVLFIGSVSSGSSGSAEAVPASNPAPMLLDNFEDGNLTTALGTQWATFDDTYMGGKSSIAASVVSGGANGSKKSLKLTGKVTTDFKYGGFAGIRMLFDDSGGSKDLTSYTGVQFYARGDGRKFRVEVMTAVVKDNNEYGTEFEAPAAWKHYQIPFSQLAQSPYFGRKVKWTGTDIRGVKFMTSGFPIESYALQIDDISIY